MWCQFKPSIIDIIQYFIWSQWNFLTLVNRLHWLSGDTELADNSTEFYDRSIYFDINMIFFFYVIQITKQLKGIFSFGTVWYILLLQEVSKSFMPFLISFLQNFEVWCWGRCSEIRSVFTLEYIFPFNCSWNRGLFPFLLI